MSLELLGGQYCCIASNLAGDCAVGVVVGFVKVLQVGCEVVILRAHSYIINDIDHLVVWFTDKPLRVVSDYFCVFTEH